ncbi:MAG: DUF4476 domain-containing protein [Bacteroidetes bacterium]|nr:DUF4476 domain-containing protein [Bacteroidota bacterium]
MRRVLLSLAFLVAVHSAFSQRIYFIYLQTESHQPFFVKMDEKLYSSTASGYIILPRLKDSVYNFTVGFPGNQAGEQKFNCLINHKDHGYLIRNYGDKGWGILDLQTNTVQMASNGDGKNGVSVTNAPVNAFTELLAKAADDSTLKQKIVLAEEKKVEPVIKEADKKTEPSIIVAKKEADLSKPAIDSVKKQDVAISNSPKQNAIAASINKEAATVKTTADTVAKQNPAEKKNETPEPVLNAKTDTELTKRTEDKIKQDSPIISTATEAESFAKSKVIRKSESSTTEGFGVTYIDIQPDGKQDTIKILIPNNDTKVQPVTTDERTNNDTSVKKEDGPAVNTTAVVASKPNFKNKCNQIASDADFYKLRKKMAGGKSDNAMMSEANKLFRTKCFTTSQIKNLGALFLGDGGKYNFFDAAYQHVSDAENFSSLQSELKDEYFVNRFKAMLR